MDPLNSEEIQNLKTSGKILKTAVLEVENALKPGISTSKLNQIAESAIRKQGAKPSFLNYKAAASPPFPASLCVSINSKVVHGVPKEDEIIKEGDVVGLDLGCVYKGMYSDMAITKIAGAPKDPIHKKLVETTKEALNIGIKNVTVGGYTGDIGHAIQSYVESKGFNVVKALVGHGVGRSAHEDPQIPNFGEKGEGELLVENTAIAIEPMVAIGNSDIKTSDDGWTIETVDGSISAHFEHTVLITSKGAEVITK